MIFSVFLETVFLKSLYALDLTESQNSLGDIFSSSIDKNEGTTTFRSMNIPTGGRTEAMGTAFTAVCDDASFFDYNPAASCVLEESEIAVYHNSWISDSAQETLAMTRRKGTLGYGAQIKCFYVPFSEYNLYGDKVSGNYYSETSATFNISYNFFAGYTFKGLSVGANGKAAWRNVPDYTDNSDDSVIKGSGLEQSALALIGDFGILTRFNALKFYQDRDANIKLGLSLTNLGTVFTGFGSEIQKDDDPPTKISLGLSYRPFERFMISLEGRKPIIISDFAQSPGMSFAVGTETKVTNNFAFQAGFLLQGANPRISMGSEFDVKGIKMAVAYTFDLTSSANPVNHISLSAKIRFGDRGRAAALKKADEYYIAGLKFYANGYYNEAILKWNEAIKVASLPPLGIRYEPAIQARLTAINFNKQKTQLENLYSINFEDE